MEFIFWRTKKEKRKFKTSSFNNEQYNKIYEVKLKKYFLEKVKDISNIIIYNKDSDSGIVSFNVDGVFAQDTAIYLNHYNIYVRAGNHCTKMLKDDLKINNTVRVSFYFYNNYSDVDKLVDALKNSKDIFNIVL